MDAAAVPESFITAYDALFEQAKLQPGECVLIHAAGGGIGTAVVQLAHNAGCTTFCTTRSSRKMNLLTKIGADVVINTSSEDFSRVISAHTEGRGVDVCIDFVGASYFDKNLRSLSTEGRLIILGLLGGISANFDLEVSLNKRLRILLTQLRERPLSAKITATRLLADRVIPLLARGVVRPVIDRAFPLDKLAVAHEYMESNRGFGKTLITLEGLDNS